MAGMCLTHVSAVRAEGGTNRTGTTIERTDLKVGICGYLCLSVGPGGPQSILQPPDRGHDLTITSKHQLSHC